MTHDEIKTKVKSCLTYLAIIQDDYNLTDATRFHEDLNMDDLDRIELHIEVEAQLNTSLPGEDLDSILTVGEYIVFLLKYLN